MDKYLSLIFLYNRAGYKKLLLLAGAIPLCFLALFFIRIGSPHETGSYMLMERAFGGILPVLIFIAVIVMGLFSVTNFLNGKKFMKADNAITGYTIRRLRMSPIKSYLTIFAYYLVMILIFWAMAIASLYGIGKLGLAVAGASDVNTRLALGLLRTDIGHVLIPIANPKLLLFNVVTVLALSGECGKACYLSCHTAMLLPDYEMKTTK